VKDVWGIILLFSILVGGIYSGFFTATEAAAIGAFAAFLLMIVTGNLSWASVRRSFTETMEVSAMVFLMLVGSIMFVLFIGVSGLPQLLSKWIVAADLPVSLFVIMVGILYIFLGCFLPTIAMLLVTLPVLLPVLIELNVNLIWFGVIFIKVAELGGITPPFGITVYVVKGVVRDDIALTEIFRGIGWFAAMDVLTIAMLMIFPQISLWLPDTMKGM
jgi:TRAP-type C4-dicarboxylate transport system permease large subunit